MLSCTGKDSVQGGCLTFTGGCGISNNLDELTRVVSKKKSTFEKLCKKLELKKEEYDDNILVQTIKDCEERIERMLFELVNLGKTSIVV